MSDSTPTGLAIARAATVTLVLDEATMLPALRCMGQETVRRLAGEMKRLGMAPLVDLEPALDDCLAALAPAARRDRRSCGRKLRIVRELVSREPARFARVIDRWVSARD